MPQGLIDNFGAAAQKNAPATAPIGPRQT